MKNDYEIRGDVTAIIIDSCKHGKMETLIDTDDLQRAMGIGTWGVSYDKSSDSYYVRGRLIGKGIENAVKLHRWLFGESLEDDLEIDHFNNDTLDNRRSTNLRKVTTAQNAQNKSIQKNNSLGARGIIKVGERYRAYSSVDGKRVHVGYFATESEAEQAVKEYRAKYMPFSKEAKSINNPDTNKYKRKPESPTLANKTSGYKNIYWKKENNRWAVQFTVNRVQKHYGCFKELSDAINRAREIREMLNRQSS